MQPLRMNLHRAARETAYWDGPASLLDQLTFEVSFDDGLRWFPTSRIGDSITVLVAGPDVDQTLHPNPPGTIVLASGCEYPVSVRAVEDPNVYIRNAGSILVYGSIG